MSLHSVSALRNSRAYLSSFPRYQSLSETHGCPLLRHRYLSDQFAGTVGLHRRDLLGHYGCVNAIEFSNNGGEFIVSGGDDRRVMVWNVEKCVYGTSTPLSLKGEHKSNIFCTIFDNENRYIFSAGNDSVALRHEFETGETVGMYYHDDPVYGLNVHPEDNDVFLTASDDGRVSLWDIRASSSSGAQSCIARRESAFHAAVFNPVDSDVIATANSRKGVQLWDVRVPGSCLKQFTHRMGQLCAMGLKWNTTGDMITALCRRLPPLLYHMDHSSPITEFHHPGYSNVCTMKSNCFAGAKDQFVVSGSDDFIVYIWKVPEDWGDQGQCVTVERAFMSLQGHRSIVNQVRFNPSNHMLISAGVEKVLKVWSPFPLPGGCSSMDILHGSIRQPYSHSDYLGFIQYGGLPLSHDEYETKSTEEDPRMIAFFDSLIQREKENRNSDSDDSAWEDLHLSIILEGGSSEDSDSDTIETSVSRLLARELLHRPTQRSPDTEPSSNTAGQGALRRLRQLKKSAVIRDLLNRDSNSNSSSDEEPENCSSSKYLVRDVEDGQNDGLSPVIINRPQRHANRRYRVRSQTATEAEISQANGDCSSMSSNCGDQSTEEKKTEARSIEGISFSDQDETLCSAGCERKNEITNNSEHKQNQRGRITCENVNEVAGGNRGNSVDGQTESFHCVSTDNCGFGTNNHRSDKASNSTILRRGNQSASEDE